MVLEEVGTAATLLIIQPEIGAIIVEFLLIALGVYAWFAAKARNYPHLANFKVAAVIAVPLTLLVFTPMGAMDLHQLWFVPTTHAMVIFLLYVANTLGTLVVKMFGKSSDASGDETYLLKLIHGDLRSEESKKVVEEVSTTIFAAYVLTLALLYLIYLLSNHTLVIGSKTPLLGVFTGAAILTIAYVYKRKQAQQYSTIKQGIIDAGVFFIKVAIGTTIILGISILASSSMGSAVENLGALTGESNPPITITLLQSTYPQICIINNGDISIAILQIFMESNGFNSILLNTPSMIPAHSAKCIETNNMPIMPVNNAKFEIEYVSQGNTIKRAPVTAYAYKSKRE